MKPKRKYGINVVPLHPPPKPTETLDVRANRELSNLLEHVNRNAETAKANLVKWGEKFNKEPAYALEWSSGAFINAARLKTAEEIAAFIAMGEEHTRDEYTSASSPLAIMREVRRLLYDEVLRRARWPEHSTSTSSNAMSLALNAERAEWLIKFDETLARLERE